MWVRWHSYQDRISRPIKWHMKTDEERTVCGRRLYPHDTKEQTDEPERSRRCRLCLKLSGIDATPPE